jgi:hypothetical protein
MTVQAGSCRQKNILGLLRIQSAAEFLSVSKSSTVPFVFRDRASYASFIENLCRCL